jgi:hypothetical protein
MTVSSVSAAISNITYDRIDKFALYQVSFVPSSINSSSRSQSLVRHFDLCLWICVVFALSLR